MLTKTSLLNGFSTLLCGSSKRPKQAVLEEQRKEAFDLCPDGLARQLATEISVDVIAPHSTAERKRVYPTAITFWAFLGQVLSEDGSCARAVARVQAWMRAKGLPVPSPSNASYVDARQSLPIELLRSINNSLNDQLDATLPESWRWRGFNVMAEDG